MAGDSERSRFHSGIRGLYAPHCIPCRVVVGHFREGRLTDSIIVADPDPTAIRSAILYRVQAGVKLLKCILTVSARLDMTIRQLVQCYDRRNAAHDVDR